MISRVQATIKVFNSKPSTTVSTEKGKVFRVKEKKREREKGVNGMREWDDEINLITNELNLICLLAIFKVIKLTRT